MGVRVLGGRPPTPAAARAYRHLVLADLGPDAALPIFSDTAARAVVPVNNPDVATAAVAAPAARHPIADIRQAVVLVGLIAPAEIARVIGRRSLAGTLPPAARPRCDAAHRRPLVVAYLAGGPARAAGPGDGGAEFAAPPHR